MRSLPLSRTLAVASVLAGSVGVGIASARTVPPSTSATYRLSPAHPALAGWNHTARYDSTGVYTMEQAERGLEVFNKVCSECHEVEDLTNEDFKFEWDGRSVWELYDLVRTTMPDENPGTLTREQYLDAIAFVLKINNQPAGPAEFAGDSVIASAAMLKLSEPDSAAVTPDSGAVKPDTLGVPPDTMVAVPDSLALPPDTLVVPDTVVVPDSSGRA